MSNTTNNEKLEADNSGDSALVAVADSVTSLVTGTSIPAPIRRNALKAFNHLCTALMDIPIAHLEGIAAEKRAETQARIKIISTGGDQITSQMDVSPEYAHAAVKKFGQKIVREQINLDKIVEVAAQQINQDTDNSDTNQEPTAEIPSIDDDWLNQFANEARQKSTEEMQSLFGRILAGEIQQPSSFSIKTLKLLGELDPNTANLFRRLCSLCVSLRNGHHIFDARVVSLGGQAASNALRDYGLNFDQLNILHEYGLIIPDYNCYMDYKSCVLNTKQQFVSPFMYQNHTWIFIPTSDQQSVHELRLSGVALSRSGKELLSIVDMEPHKEYDVALQSYLATRGLKMLQVPQPNS